MKRGFLFGLGSFLVVAVLIGLRDAIKGECAFTLDDECQSAASVIITFCMIALCAPLSVLAIWEGKRSVTEQVEAARCWRVADRVLLHPCRVDSGGLINRAHRVGDGPALNIGTKGSSVSVRLAISSTHSRNAALRACSAASRDQVARWMHSGSATQLFTGPRGLNRRNLASGRGPGRTFP